MTIGYIGDVQTALPAACATDPATGILSDIVTGSPCETIMTQMPSSSSSLGSLAVILPIGLLVVFAILGARR